jgi:hypothetical protein
MGADRIPSQVPAGINAVTTLPPIMANAPAVKSGPVANASPNSWVGGRLSDIRLSSRLRFAYGDADYYRDALAHRDSVPEIAKEFPNLGKLQEAARESHSVPASYEAVLPAAGELSGSVKTAHLSALLGMAAILPAAWSGLDDLNVVVAAVGLTVSGLVGALSLSGRRAADGNGVDVARRVFGGVSGLASAAIAAGGAFLYGASGDLVGAASAVAGAIGAGVFLNMVPTALVRGVAGLHRSWDARARRGDLGKAFNALYPLLEESGMGSWFNVHPEDELTVATEVLKNLSNEKGRWKVAEARTETEIRGVYAANAVLREAGLTDEDYRRQYEALEARLNALKSRREECRRVIVEYEAALAEAGREKAAVESRILLQRMTPPGTGPSRS